MVFSAQFAKFMPHATSAWQ